jgi:hypothetical protein
MKTNYRIPPTAVYVNLLAKNTRTNGVQLTETVKTTGAPCTIPYFFCSKREIFNKRADIVVLVRGKKRSTVSNHYSGGQQRLGRHDGWTF